MKQTPRNVLVIASSGYLLNFLSPVLEELRDRHHCALTFLCWRSGLVDEVSKRYPGHPIFVNGDPGLIDQLRPHLIICVEVWWEAPDILKQARKRNIPILTYDHGSLCFPCEYCMEKKEYISGYRGDTTLASHIACWGELGKQSWLSYGPMEEKMVLTGAVQYDVLYRKRVSRNQVCRHLNIPPEKKIILLFCAMHHIVPKWRKRIKETALRVKKWVDDNDRYHLVVHHHPLDVQRGFSSPFLGSPGATVIANPGEERWRGTVLADLGDVIHAADAVASTLSSVLFAPVILGKPILHIEAEIATSQYFSALGKDYFINLRKGMHLDTAMKKTLEPKDEKWRQAGRKLAALFNYNNDGNARQRVVKLALDILEEQKKGGDFYPLSIEEEYLQSHSRFRDLPYPYHFLIRYYGDTGDLSQARSWLETYIQRFKQHGPVFQWLLDACFKHSETETVEDLLHTYFDSSAIPLDDRALFKLAVNCRLNAMYPRALSIFQRLLDSPSNSPGLSRVKIVYEYGLAHLQSGAFEDALVYFKEVLDHTSKRDVLSYRVLYRLGETCFYLKQPGPSLDYLDRCLEACPNHKAARKIRNQLMQQSPQPVPPSRQKRKDLFIEKPGLTQHPQHHQLASLYGSYYFEHIHTWDNAFSKMFSHKEPLCSKEDNILLVGCCFASVLKRELIRQGYNAFDFPGEERYTTFSIEQEFKRLLTANPNDNQAQPEIWQLGDNSYASSRMKYVFGQSPETVMEKTRQAEQTFSRRLREADVLLIAFGLTEGWRDKNSKEVYVQLPFPQVLNLERMEHFTSGFKENLETMERIYRLIIEYTKAKPVFCISPVPLQATFTALDCIEADAGAKAILRTAIFELKRQYKNIRYFPAYEAVMYNLDNQSFFKKDKRHVNNTGIKRIGELFTRMYLK